MTISKYERPPLSDFSEVLSFPCAPERHGLISFPSIEGAFACNVYVVENQDPKDRHFHYYVHRKIAEAGLEKSGLTHSVSNSPDLAHDKITIHQSVTDGIVNTLSPDQNCIVLSGPKDGRAGLWSLRMGPKMSAIIAASTMVGKIHLDNGAKIFVKPKEGNFRTLGICDVTVAAHAKAIGAVDAHGVFVHCNESSSWRADIGTTRTLSIRLSGQNSRVVTNGHISQTIALDDKGYADGQLFVHVGWIESRGNPIVPDKKDPKKEDPRFSYVSMTPYSPAIPKFE